LDILLEKINADGSHGFTAVINTGSDIDMALGIVIDSDDNLYYSGYFSNTEDLDITDSSDIRTSSGGYDIFLTKLSTIALDPTDDGDDNDQNDDAIGGGSGNTLDDTLLATGAPIDILVLSTVLIAGVATGLSIRRKIHSIK
ncbi:hypothetical protein ACFL1U_02340, partial [Patescibacteria group bacterium]